MRTFILAIALSGLVAAAGCRGTPAGSNSAYAPNGDYIEGGTALQRQMFVQTNGGSGGGS